MLDSRLRGNDGSDMGEVEAGSRGIGSMGVASC